MARMIVDVERLRETLLVLKTSPPTTEELVCSAVSGEESVRAGQRVFSAQFY
jgi:hypothetical protein